MVDLNRFQHFVMVADEMHFTRAAIKLGIGQPQLSRSVNALEQSLGIRLFERGTRKIRLTQAGEIFLQEARRMLMHAERAQRLAHGALDDEMMQIKIGVKPSAFFKVLPEVLVAFREQWPNVDVKITEMDDRAQIPALHDGSIDLGFLDNVAEAPEGLEMLVVERSPITTIAIPSRWPLSRRKSVRLAELAPLPFVGFSHSHSPRVHTKMIAACRNAGFVPNVVQEVNHVFTRLSLVAGGVGICLAADTTREIGTKGITFVPVVGLPPELYLEHIIAWLPRALPPTLRGMIALIERKSSASKSLGNAVP